MTTNNITYHLHEWYVLFCGFVTCLYDLLDSCSGNVATFLDFDELAKEVHSNAITIHTIKEAIPTVMVGFNMTRRKRLERRAQETNNSKP